jgi:phosphoserine aminotransferase
MLISFYPGPSKVYPQVSQYMQEAMQTGILSMNHRSPVFVSLCAETIHNMKQKLHIPDDYTIVFTSSATECWEIVAQSFLQKDDQIYACVCGAFAQKWAQYTQKLCQYASKAVSIEIFDTELPTTLPMGAGKKILCLTPNETSNGTCLPIETMRAWAKEVDFSLFDVTSCLGGIDMPFEIGDVWFASVQKCLGLPAGLAVCILSPRAIERAYQINERTHYNSLPYILDNIHQFQTTHTPNVLNIFLLNKVMQQVPPIQEVERVIYQRAERWYHYFVQFSDYQIIASPETRSPTVICVTSTEENIRQVKTAMQARGIVVGNGYDRWKNTTFRIANFPAITEEEIDTFMCYHLP